MLPIPTRMGLTAATLAAILTFTTSATGQVSGTVLDTAGYPVADAFVSVQATSLRTTTAPDGGFSLPGANGSNLWIVVAKKGYFNIGQPVLVTPASGLQFQIEAVPAWSDPLYDLVDPSVCYACHPDQYEDWNGSPMSAAGTNLWLYDIYDGTGTPGGMGGFVYQRDSSHLAHAPVSDCAPCHQPGPWVKTLNPNQGLDPIGSLSTGAVHGVSCDVCHKIASVNEQNMDYPGLFPQVTTFTKPPLAPFSSYHEPVQYGVLGDTYFNGSIMRPSYQPQLTAAMCATCHQDTNDHDDDGVFGDPGSITSEPTWDEWKASPYSNPTDPRYADCVDCHMKPTGATTAVAYGLGPIRDPETIRGHDIRGTTPEYLQNAADLDLVVQQSGTTLTVDVTVTNSMAGHALPTGVTVRNMILLVEAFRDFDGAPLVHTGSQLVHDLAGVGDPAQGYFAGLPGKVYAKHNEDISGNGPVFYTEATAIRWDNRIAALASDSTQYSFDVPPATGPVSVRARLIYRRSFRFLVDAKSWTVDGKGEPLEDVLAPDFGHRMEERRWPDAPLTVSTPPLLAGTPGVVHADGAWQGNAVVFVGSLAGLGTTSTNYGFDLGLSGPIRLLGWARADSAGHVSVTTPTIPLALFGRQVWLQAIEKQHSATFELSAVHAPYVQ